MNLALPPKQLILLAFITLVTPLALPRLMVPVLESIRLKNQSSPAAAYQPSTQALVDICKKRINQATQTSEELLRIDTRSTGFREALFNVHGYVRHPGGEFDFQCWFNEDYSFDTFAVGRVSLEEIQRASALKNF